MHTRVHIGNTSPHTSAYLVGALQERCALLRRLHPVSVLDLSITEDPTIELARWLRTLQRKSRLMTFEWAAAKSRDAFLDYSEVMVEKGLLPGMHFSEQSFDFVVGVNVLGYFPAERRERVLKEVVRTALRSVMLVEEPAGAMSSLQALIGRFGPRGSLSCSDGMCLLVVD